LVCEASMSDSDEAKPDEAKPDEAKPDAAASGGGDAGGSGGAGGGAPQGAWYAGLNIPHLKDTGPDQMDLHRDWGANGGDMYSDMCTFEPCCGSPCDFGSGMYCCLCWTFCSICSIGKMYASDTDQRCVLVNHCVFVFIAALVLGWIWAIIVWITLLIVFVLLFWTIFLWIIVWWVVIILYWMFLFPMFPIIGLERHNRRARLSIGEFGSFFGDALAGLFVFTWPCSICQMLRSVPKEHWDWLTDCQTNGLEMFLNEVKYLYDPNAPVVAPAATATATADVQV